MLQSQEIQQSESFFAFSDSSWNDDMDTGLGTGCFIVTYIDGVLDHSSNMPDPVALSSAEAEYNEGYITFMTMNHLRMLLCDLEGVEESTMPATNVYFDSKSAIAMGNSYKDKKHTRHISKLFHYEVLGNKYMISDIGMKQLPAPQHEYLMELIHIQVRDQCSLIQKG
jgi:hypothetical protein